MWGHGCFPKVGYKKGRPQRCAAGRKKRGRLLLPLGALLTFEGVSVLIVSLSLLSSSLSAAWVIINADICSDYRANKVSVCVSVCGLIGDFDLGLSCHQQSRLRAERPAAFTCS